MLRVVIDPGHGGTQPGCSGNGLVEKDLTLATANALEHILQACGVSASTTRTTDETLPIYARGHRSSMADADMVAVIHFDTSADPKTGFMTAYCLAQDIVTLPIAEKIGRVAPATLRHPTPSPVIAAKEGWTNHAFNVLNTHAPRHPVLIECAFLSNPSHVSFLKSDYGIPAIANAIAAGILRGWQLLKGPNGNPAQRP